MKIKNSPWIPGGLTILYVYAAYAIIKPILVKDAADPGGWFHFGEFFAWSAIVLVPVWIFIMWILYGTLWMGKPHRGGGGLLLMGLSPVIAFGVWFATGIIMVLLQRLTS